MLMKGTSREGEDKEKRRNDYLKRNHKKVRGKRSMTQVERFTLNTRKAILPQQQNEKQNKGVLM